MRRTWSLNLADPRWKISAPGDILTFDDNSNQMWHFQFNAPLLNTFSLRTAGSGTGVCNDGAEELQSLCLKDFLSSSQLKSVSQIHHFHVCDFECAI